jgi:hypothetical protein
MARAKELKFKVQDRPGMLGEVAAALGAAKVNLRGINAWVEGEEGIIRIVVDKHAVAKKLLAKRGWQPEEREVVEIEVADKPGALGEAATKLGKAGVNITHVFVGTGVSRKATIFLGVSDPKAAAKALR